MVFLTEEWFWRGTQSAIFYYVSCAPWIEYKHKRKRRQEAQRSRKEADGNVIYIQPGMIRQPAPFQTNKEWAEEIVAGPGPPKGWQKDALYYEYTKANKQGEQNLKSERARGEAVASTSSPAKSDWTTANSSASTTVQPSSSTQASGAILCTDSVQNPETDVSATPTAGHDGTRLSDGADRNPGTSSRSLNDARVDPASGLDRSANHLSSNRTETTGSKRSSFESSTSVEFKEAAPRPSIDRRISQAMDGFKETMRTALHPDHWNWIRYDRDDEILPNLNERMKSMWGSVKINMTSFGEDDTLKLKQIETREKDTAREVQKWQRGTHPAINDLHPPIASQLPLTQDEARWMLMPPASADVMMGRRRPDAFDDTKRRPLCLIGSATPEITPVQKPRLPSDNFQHDVSSTEDEDWLPERAHVQKPQRAHLKRNRTEPATLDYVYFSDD